MINIAKKPEDRIEKNGTQKGYAQTGVVVFEKKKRSEKSESEKRFAQTGIVLFQKRKGSEKKFCSDRNCTFPDTTFFLSCISAAASNSVSRG